MFEKDIYPFIYVDGRTNVVSLLVPLSTGEFIALDNTCQSVAELKKFCGQTPGYPSALGALKAMQTDLQQDLRDMAPDSSMSLEKADRLCQVKQYIQALESAAFHEKVSESLTRGVYPTYPSVIQDAFLCPKENAFSIILSPKRPDFILSLSKGAIFAFSRPQNWQQAPEIYRSCFVQTLEERFSSESFGRINVKTKKEKLLEEVEQKFGREKGEEIKSLAEEKQPKNVFSELRAFMEEQLTSALGETIDLKISAEGVEITFQYLVDLGVVGDASDDDPSGFFEVAEQILDAALEQDCLDKSPFLKSAKEPYKLSIVIQFLIGVVNVYCHAHKVGPEVNVGEKLEAAGVAAENALYLATMVESALEGGASVEDAIISVVESLVYGEGVFAEEQRKEIRELFSNTWPLVAEAPHHDEFLFCLSERPGPCVNFRGTISADFSLLMQFLDPNNDFFKEQHNKFKEVRERYSGKLPHKRVIEVSEVIATQRNICSDMDEGNYEAVAAWLLQPAENPIGMKTRNFECNAIFRGLLNHSGWAEVEKNVVHIMEARLGLRFLTAMRGAIPEKYFLSKELDSYHFVILDDRISSSLCAMVDFTKGPGILQSFGGSLCPGRLEAALKALNIPFRENIKPNQVGDGHVANMPLKHFYQLLKDAKPYRDKFYLSKDMACSIYRAVKLQFGSEGTAAINALSNENKPNKIRKALALLGVEVKDGTVAGVSENEDSIDFYRTNGYRVTVRDRELREEIYRLSRLVPEDSEAIESSNQDRPDDTGSGVSSAVSVGSGYHTTVSTGSTDSAVSHGIEEAILYKFVQCYGLGGWWKTHVLTVNSLIAHARGRDSWFFGLLSSGDRTKKALEAAFPELLRAQRGSFLSESSYSNADIASLLRRSTSGLTEEEVVDKAVKERFLKCYSPGPGSRFWSEQPVTPEALVRHAQGGNTRYCFFNTGGRTKQALKKAFPSLVLNGNCTAEDLRAACNVQQGGSVPLTY